MGKEKLTKEEFIKRAKEIHGDKYDYSKLTYEKLHEKGFIICNEHGGFWQRLSNHLKGSGCPKCAAKNASLKQSLGLNEFIKKADKIHDNKYDYSKVDYVNNRTKVCIICPEHGEFWQNPHEHLSGYGCRKCANNHLSKIQRMSVSDFIEKAHKVHGDKYDYSKVEYINYDTPVCIICPEHGEFWQTPHTHLNNHVCPFCASEKNLKEEALYSELLKSIKEEILRYKKFKWLKNKLPLSIDIYIPNKKIGIEYQGVQHFKPNSFFGGDKCFEKQKENDILKIKLCEEHKIHLIHFTYNKKDCENWNLYEVITDINLLIKKINEYIPQK